MTDEETRVDEAPSAEPLGPADYTRAERRVFGLPPTGVVVVLAAGALGAGAALLAEGNVAVGLLALATAAALGVVWWETARHLRASWFDRAALRTADRGRDGSRLAVGSARAVLHATGRVAALRLEAQALQRRRRGLLLELGRAVHREDEAETSRVRAALAELESRLEASAAAERDVREAARRRLHDERLAAGATEPHGVVEPDAERAQLRLPQ